MDERNMKIFVQWFDECNYELAVYRIKLTLPANPGMVHFKNEMRTKKKVEFLRQWNRIDSMCRQSGPICERSLNLDLVHAEIVIEEIGTERWHWDWVEPKGEAKRTDVFFRVWWRGIVSSRGPRRGKKRTPAGVLTHASSLPPPAQHPAQHSGIPI